MKILIVEDDERLASVVERAVHEAGWTSEVARDGVEAEHLLRTGAGDAVVLDLGLPGKSGLDVLRRLRARGSTVPVLILTGRDAVGAYWIAQFEVMRPEVTPVAFDTLPDGRVVVTADQSMRKPDGRVWANERVTHVITFGSDDRIRRMDPS